MKKISYFLLAMILALVVFPSGQAFATNYPGTSVTMTPGDVLSSPKSWSSTKFLGHVAIVGPKNEVIHSHPVEDRVVVESVSSFASRHASTDVIEIYRAKSSSAATTAASWAYNNASKSTNYSLTAGYYDIVNNYCSKWVWQAFYLSSAKYDLVFGTQMDRDISDGLGVPITPSGLKSSSKLTKVGSFKR